MSQIPPILKAIINDHSVNSLRTWLTEQQISLPATSENFYDGVQELIDTKDLSLELLKQGVAELEENSNKKVVLFEVKKTKSIIENRAAIIKYLKNKFGNFDIGIKYEIKTANKNPTLNCCYWDNQEIKIKFAEKHVEIIPNVETQSFESIEKRVIIVLRLDLKGNFAELRFDKAGNQHVHKNDEGKSTETAYEDYYKALMLEIFSVGQFAGFDMNGIANHIRDNMKNEFRLTKGVNTITSGDKMSITSRSTKADVRDSVEYARAASTPGAVWRAEDLTGYWKKASTNPLKNDLYMRIYRSQTQVKVQRGCTANELQYGLDQIRAIQAAL